MNPDKLTEEQQLRNQVEWLKKENARHVEDIDHLYDDLRDRFAMAALTGILSATEGEGRFTQNGIDGATSEAYKFADAMMCRRRAGKEGG